MEYLTRVQPARFSLCIVRRLNVVSALHSILSSTISNVYNSLAFGN